MKSIIRVFTIVLFVFLSGCTTVQEIGSFNLYENFSRPELNTKTTISIGDEMLSQGVLYKTQAIHIIADSCDGFVKKGYYRLHKYAGNGKVAYEPIESTGARIILKGSFSGPLFLVYSPKLIDSSSGKYSDSEKELLVGGYNGFGDIVCIRPTLGVSSKNLYGIIPPENYELTTAVIQSDSNFQQTLIYTGREGNIIKFTYREFFNDFARPSFTIDVQYDLSLSNEISIKNARFLIHEANNNSITYTVLRNFNQ